MKKFKNIIIVISVFLLGFIAYSNYNNRPKKWTPTNCYSKILYKVEPDGKKGKQMRWKLQFKNNYSQMVTFNYGVTEDENNYLTTHRKTMKAKDESEPIEIFTKSDQFYILVDKLSLNVSGKPVEACDEQ
jgi:predicted negative regulator of RcsB-dependent stress response